MEIVPHFSSIFDTVMKKNIKQIIKILLQNVTARPIGAVTAKLLIQLS